MVSYEDIVNLCVRRSLFYPASEIYADAPAGFYDFGPYGATIRRKIAELWRKEMVQKEDMLEIDGATTMPETVYHSSGHLKHFNDPMTQCKKCNTLHRADQLLTALTKKEFKEAMSDTQLTTALRDAKAKCPKCRGELMDVRRFNMLVPASVGAAGKTVCYMRPETCQSIFCGWDRLTKTMRIKLPKGVAQVGKSFRNEISPRQTLLRQVEFNQMEIEVFFDPKQIDTIEGWDDVKGYGLRIQRANEDKVTTIPAEKLVKDKIVSGKLIAYYLVRTQQLYEKYGFPFEKLRFRELDEEERAFYAKEGWDFEVQTAVGWLELIANNYRTDYDIKGHAHGSKKDMFITRDDGSKFIPHVWEISMGHDRIFYSILDNSYRKDKKRVWLTLPPLLAPLQIGIFPLLSNKPDLVKNAKEIHKDLKGCFETFYDDSGSIGKRYARADEIGIPFCMTIDFDSLEKKDVTIRDRDSTAQKRVPIKDLRDVLFKLLTGKVKVEKL